jgi:cob(I)alamin adenosyltransferase
MDKKIVQVFFGQGKGKTSAAVGQCVRAASLGKRTIIIQFLKGTDAEELSFLGKLEPDIKLFRFDKSKEKYSALSPKQQEEEKQNLLNGLNFAKKVIETRECDVLVLDEVLDLIDHGIITLDEIKEIISLRDDYQRLIMTGLNIPEDLIPFVDVLLEIQLIKDTTV